MAGIGPAWADVSYSGCTGACPQPRPPNAFFDYGPLVELAPDEQCALTVESEQFDVRLEVAAGGNETESLLALTCPYAPNPVGDPCADPLGVRACNGDGSSPVLLETTAGTLYAHGWRDTVGGPHGFRFVIDDVPGGATVTGYRVARKGALGSTPFDIVVGASEHWCEALASFEFTIPAPLRQRKHQDSVLGPEDGRGLAAAARSLPERYGSVGR